MKATEVKIGDKVKTSTHPDAQVYTVTEVCWTMVKLQYTTESGMTVSGGVIDVSLLTKV